MFSGPRNKTSFPLFPVKILLAAKFSKVEKQNYFNFVNIIKKWPLTSKCNIRKIKIWICWKVKPVPPHSINHFLCNSVREGGRGCNTNQVPNFNVHNSSNQTERYEPKRIHCLTNLQSLIHKSQTLSIWNAMDEVAFQIWILIWYGACFSVCFFWSG